MEVAVFSFGEASCLVVVQTFTSSTQVQSTGPVIVTRFFFHMCVFLEGLWVFSSFSWTTMHHVIAQKLPNSSYRVRILNVWIGRHDLRISIPSSMYGHVLAARTLPPVTIRELRLSLQYKWAAMPQQFIDTLILSMGSRCETYLSVRGDHNPY
ncbi:transposable element Tcb2 transposase [Trichonephila clavipes]|nr:transposable element Tcb2 transposase [Trichonephila clavipes]